MSLQRASRTGPPGSTSRHPASAKSGQCLLTFDIEEWFQVENLRSVFPRAHWDRIPRRVVDATRSLLDLLAEGGRRATFFVLGWVAEREPALIREIADHGHEIAAHGHGHVLPMQLTGSEFRIDVLRARKVLEDITGQPVRGYRAPSFNLNHEHLAILGECGFRYDSSFHPFTLHDRYARLDGLAAPLRPGVHPIDGGMMELALPVEHWRRLPLPIAGGGYFRLYPGALFRRLVRRALARDGHYLMYLHSWEFDPWQPRVKVPGFGYGFRHYNNLRRTLPRMRRLIAMLDTLGAAFVTAAEFIDSLRGAPANGPPGQPQGRVAASIQEGARRQAGPEGGDQ